MNEDGCHELVVRTDRTTDAIFASCGTNTKFGTDTKIYRNSDAAGQGNWDVVLAEENMGLTSLAIAPSNQNVIYAMAAASSFDSNGVLHAFFRSIDGGATWTARVRDTDPPGINNSLLSYACNPGGFGQGWYDNVIAVDPSDADKVWAGGINVFRSDDGDANWGLASSDVVHTDVHALVFHPRYDGAANNVLYVGSDGGISKTGDARGAANPFCGNPNISWTNLNNNYGVTQFYHGMPYPDGTRYFGGAQDNGTISGSDANGANAWTTILGGDGGVSWTSVDGSGTTGIPDHPVLSIIVDPSNSSKIYVGTDIGVFVTLDGGANWARENTGFANAPTEALAITNSGGNPQLFAFTHGRGAWRVSIPVNNCSYSITPNGGSFGASGGGGSFNVNAPNGCGWSPISGADWIAITDGGSGSGGGTIGFSLAANTSFSQRQGTNTVGGQTFTVTQTAASASEADISPRPNGDGFIDANDIQQIRRFSVGLDLPYQSNEFQRADNSPRIKSGDGFVDADDIQQARRYSVGLDAKQSAGGQIAGGLLLEEWKSTNRAGGVFDNNAPPTEMRVENITASIGRQVTVPITVNTRGNESSFTFSLAYDRTKLSNPVVTLGAAGGDVVTNITSTNPDANPIGFSVTSFAGGTIAAGANQLLLKIRFTVASHIAADTTTLTFGDAPSRRKVSGIDPNAPLAQSLFADGTVIITARSKLLVFERRKTR